MSTSLIDYVNKINQVNIDNPTFKPITSAKQLPFLIESAEAYTKFDTAEKLREWVQELNTCIASEFDESCYPVDWEQVEAPPSITYINFETEPIDADHVWDFEQEGWVHLPANFQSIDDYICFNCGWMVDSPAHTLQCGGKNG